MKAAIGYSFLNWTESQVSSGGAGTSDFTRTIRRSSVTTDASGTMRYTPESVTDPIKDVARAEYPRKQHAIDKLLDYINLDAVTDTDVARRLQSVMCSLLELDYAQRINDGALVLSAVYRRKHSVLEELIARAMDEMPLDGNSADFWSAVILALGQTKQITELEPFLKSSIVSIRIIATEALGYIGKESAHKQLLKMRTDSSQQVREVAQELLTS
jgi:hypothetical protein